MTDTKIMFFDIDGTLISDETKEFPESAMRSIRQARANGHKMFINTGRCLYNIDSYIRDIGFDGMVCACGTHIIYNNQDLLYVTQPLDLCSLVVKAGIDYHLDVVFESRTHIGFTSNLRPYAQALYESCFERGFQPRTDISSDDFSFDKFVVWIEEDSNFPAFLNAVSPYFTCIDRGENFKEFVPIGYSKASGIQFLLDHLNIPLDHAYAIGDSNNDLPMLEYVPNSIAMGNSQPSTLFEKVSYITTTVEEDGVEHALKHFHFIA
ncbi:MAG: HAD family hydrolase [Candidatus Fimimorpha sp.]